MTGWPYRHPPNGAFEVNTASPQARGLIFWLPLGVSRPTGTRHVDLVRGVELGSYNTPEWVMSSERGWALDFVANGNESDYLQADVAPHTSYPFSWSLWFRSTDISETSSLMFVGDGSSSDIYWRLQSVAYSSVQFLSRDGTTRTSGTTTNLVQGVWYHCAAICSSSTSREVYLNAVYEGGNYIDSTPSVVNRISIGISGDSSPFPRSDATMNDIRVYNRALSMAELRAIYAPETRWELYRPVARWWVGYTAGGGPAQESGALTAARQGGASVAAVAATYGGVAGARAVALGESGEANAQAAVAHGRAMGIADAGAAAAVGSASMGRAAGDTLSAVMAAARAVGQAMGLGIGAAGIAEAQGAVALERAHGITLLSVTEGNVAVALALGLAAGVTTQAQATTASRVDLEIVRAVAEAGQAVTAAGMDLAQVETLTLIGAVEGAVDVALALGLAAGATTQAQATTASRVDLEIVRAVAEEAMRSVSGRVSVARAVAAVIGAIAAADGVIYATIARDIDAVVGQAAGHAEIGLVAVHAATVTWLQPGVGTRRVVRIVPDPRDMRVPGTSRVFVIVARERSSDIK